MGEKTAAATSERMPVANESDQIRFHSGCDGSDLVLNSKGFSSE
jgi:hypothetical protein